MLTIIVPRIEFWNERAEAFIVKEEVTLELEHSLTAICKWESKWHTSFLSRKNQTTDETIDYIKCMTLTQNVPDEVYTRLSEYNYKQINDYIEDPMSATKIYSEEKKGGKNDIITAELIFYWMASLQIPFSCADWHLNRLMKLIEVSNVKNSPPKKHTRNELLSRNARLNEERKKKYNTKG